MMMPPLPIAGNVSTIAANDFTVAPQTFSAAPPVSATQAAVQIGSGGFAGAGGHFAGDSLGTGLGFNFAAGFAGNALDIQVAGVSKARINAAGYGFFGGTLPAITEAGVYAGKGADGSSRVALFHATRTWAMDNAAGQCRWHSGGIVYFFMDANQTANETALQLSVAGGATVRVSVGAADSGGVGFRVLRVPN